MTEKADAPGAAATPGGDAATGDAAKDRFREALERKRGTQAARHSEAHGDSKIHGTHAAAGGKRTFRRKSGG